MSEIKFHPYIDGLIKYAFANPMAPMWEMEVEQARKTRDRVIAGLMGPAKK